MDKFKNYISNIITYILQNPENSLRLFEFLLNLNGFLNLFF